MKNGQVVFAAHEERFSRKKHDANFPKLALQKAFDQEKISIQDIHHLVFYEKPFLKFERLIDTYADTSPFGFWSFRSAMKNWLSKKLWISADIKKETGFKKDILFTEHHESHAASAFFPSSFKEAVIVTMDGVGEKATASIAIGKENKIEIIEEQYFPHSAGLFYSAVTYYCGFKVNSGEYKLMGFAPYGKPRFVETMKKYFIQINDNGSIQLNQKYFNYQSGFKMIKPSFEKVLGKKRRKPEEENSQFYMDIAASAQAIIEEIVLKTVTYAIKLTGIKNVCLAGGVALNCKANGLLLEKGIADNIWIQPASGDSGGALGSAYAIWYNYLNNERVIEPNFLQKHAYLGSSYSNKEIELTLSSLGVTYTKTGEEEALLLLSKKIKNKEVIGWFQGKMEYGPRALGNRSILASPTFKDMKSFLNQKIKKREGFRPFAPIVLEEKAQDWFTNISLSKYMLFTFQSDKKSTIPSCIHEDDSARVQTINKNENSRLYKLIEEVEKQTGAPILINTSFNVRGEPIVESPFDALKCFFQTDMDTLYIGDYIIEKTTQKNIDPSLLKNSDFELD
jgi:carbamoyltransferase